MVDRRSPSIRSLYLLMVIIIKGCFVNSVKSTPTENWKFHFPGGSGMGLFLALALPLDNSKNTFLAYNFEAHYNLPDSKVDYEYPLLIERKTRNFVDRKFIYDAIEFKINLYGFPGKNCMLRAICEASEESLEHNGVLGDILHIVFTPSSSKNNITNEYETAETKGRQRKCADYNKNCTISLLGLISWIGEAL